MLFYFCSTYFYNVLLVDAMRPFGFGFLCPCFIASCFADSFFVHLCPCFIVWGSASSVFALVRIYKVLDKKRRNPYWKISYTLLGNKLRNENKNTK